MDAANAESDSRHVLSTFPPRLLLSSAFRLLQPLYAATARAAPRAGRLSLGSGLGGGRLPPSLARRAILSTATSRGRWPAMCVRLFAFGSHASPSSHATLEMKAGSRRTIASLPVILSSLSELLPDILLARSLLPFTYLRRERLLRTKFLTGSEVYKRMLLHAMLPLSQRQACNSRSRIPSCLTLITVPHYLSPPSLHR